VKPFWLMMSINNKGDKKMKKYVVLTFGLVLFLSATTAVEAKSWQAEIQEDRTKLREEIRNKIATASPASLRQQIWEGLHRRFPFLLPAGINRLAIKEISSTTLPAEIKVVKDDQSITLKISGKTIILRKFGGKSSLAELHVGDIVTARGTWVDETKAVLDTRVLRDLSIQKRYGTFWGKIKSISSETKTFVLETAGRGEQRVFVGSETKIVSRNQTVLTFSDLVIGHRVRVTGLWDSTLKTIEEVKTIKDWSLPPKPTLTPTPVK